MKLKVLADNYTVEFDENDNIECFEGYFTAKNVEQLFGKITSNHVFVGAHVRGNNTAASGTLTIGGTIANDANTVMNFPLAPQNTMLNKLATFSGTGNINWWFSNLVISPTPWNLTQLKVSIANSSTFTGTAYIRLFFKVR